MAIRRAFDGARSDLSIGPARAAIRGQLNLPRLSAGGGIIDCMSSTPTPEQTATIAALLDAAGRKSKEVPLRRTLLQQGDQRNPVPGPLASIVKRHDELALDLYLVHRAAASSAPWDVTRDARIWGRVVGHGTDVDGGASIVSKAWRRLDETYGLVKRERRGRLAKITALDESGDGGDYSYPVGGGYFKLPFAYWTADDNWYTELTLPAKASLLIALSLKQPFVLPAERAGDWYGISPDTIQRGLQELREHGLLSRKFDVVDDYLSPTMKRTDYRFRLKTPFTRRRKVKKAASLLSVVGE